MPIYTFKKKPMAVKRPKTQEEIKADIEKEYGTKKGKDVYYGLKAKGKLGGTCK
jgi:hypothetical protein